MSSPLPFLASAGTPRSDVPFSRSLSSAGSLSTSSRLALSDSVSMIESGVQRDQDPVTIDSEASARCYETDRKQLSKKNKTKSSERSSSRIKGKHSTMKSPFRKAKRIPRHWHYQPSADLQNHHLPSKKRVLSSVSSPPSVGFSTSWLADAARADLRLRRRDVRSGAVLTCHFLYHRTRADSSERRRGTTEATSLT